jgi:hypothetical protein
MPNPSPETINKVMQWLAFADDDLETATYVMGYNSGAPYRINVRKNASRLILYITMSISHIHII